MWLHAVGACPQLRSLHHNAWGATAAQLGQYTMLQSLSDMMRYDKTVQCSLVEGLTPLTRLQHLHLSQCVPRKIHLFWIAMVLRNCNASRPCNQTLHAPKSQLCQAFDLIWSTYHCEGAGHSYRSGNGFSEVLHLEGLRTLRLEFVYKTKRLYFAEGFSQLTALTSVELHSGSDYRPTFSASPSPIMTASALLRCRYTPLGSVKQAGSTDVRPQVARWATYQLWKCCLYTATMWRRQFPRAVWWRWRWQPPQAPPFRYVQGHTEKAYRACCSSHQPVAVMELTSPHPPMRAQMKPCHSCCRRGDVI